MGKERIKEEGLRVKEKTRKMKDSGVEWIGEVPENWRIQNLKSILVERNENNKPVKTDFILSLTNDRGVIPYSEKGDIGNKSKDDLTGYKLAYPNDIVLNSMNVIIGSVGLSKYFGAVSPVYYMLYPRSEEDSVRYYNFIFQTKVFQESLKGYGNGIMEHRLRIPMMKLNTVMLPYPSAKEQREIANFLDSKVYLIDDIIEKTKQSIEDYKKYKQSLITETVTKGLNPDVEMKDSGIEWIGEIPKHWDVIQLKRFSAVCSGKEIEVELNENDSDSIAVYGSGGVFKFTNSYLYDKPSVLFGRKGTIGKPIYLDKKFWTVDTMYFVKFNDKIVPKFCYYYLTFYPWDIIMTKTALPSIVGVDVENSFFAFPSITEQKQIADYLDNKCSYINRLIEKKEQLINELETYKKSLIYEYVTGKKRVGMQEKVFRK